MPRLLGVGAGGGGVNILAIAVAQAGSTCAPLGWGLDVRSGCCFSGFCMVEVVLEAPLTHSGVEGVGAQGAALRWRPTSRAGLGKLPALPRPPEWLLWTRLLVASVLLPRAPWPEPLLALGQHWELGGCLHWDGGGRSCGHAVLLRGHGLSAEARQRCVLCPHRCYDRRRWHRRLRESSGALEHLQSSRSFWWCQVCPGHAARCRRRRGQISDVRGRLEACVLCTCVLCRWVGSLRALAHTCRCHVSCQ